MPSHPAKNSSHNSSHNSKPKLGTGERFAQLKSKLSGQGVKDPGALAASIGRKKFGKKRFQKLAATGSKRKRAMGMAS